MVTEAKKKFLKKEFNELKKKSTTKFREGWEEFKIRKDGKVYIRCQSKKRDGSGLQCGRKAVKGKLVCQLHDGVRSKKTQIEKFKEQSKTGLYDTATKNKLRKELSEIEQLDSTQLEEVKGEIKLAIATLRTHIKTHSDDKITEKPGSMIWLLKQVVEMKKVLYDMTHQDKVMFTKEQVEYLVVRIRSIIIKHVKDMKILQAISDEVAELGYEIRKDGFRKI